MCTLYTVQFVTHNYEPRRMIKKKLTLFYFSQNIRAEIENDLKGGGGGGGGPSAGEIARLNAEKKLFGVQVKKPTTS